MRDRVQVAFCALLLALAGCGGSSDPGRGDGTVRPGGGSGGSGGASGTAGTGGTGGIDNPNGPPIAAVGGVGGVTGGQGGGGGDCPVGMFCPPSTDEPGCGTLELETDVEIIREPGNLLVVFDQSASMNDAWGTSNKLQAAQDALTNAIMPLADQLTIGAILFPTLACIPFIPPPAGGVVAPITDPLQISFRPGPEFLTVWNGLWPGGEGSGLGTPVNEAMDRAAVAIQEASATLTGVTAVMLFTDGAPNCFPDPMTQGIPTQLETATAAGWLAGMPSIKTYVVGLPGAMDAPILNDIAVSGGTMSYITPDDPAVLEAKLNEIVLSTVKMGFDSCTLTLDPPAQVAEKLQIIVKEATNGDEGYIPRDLGGGSGWTISDDGSTVELMGGICDDAMSGRFSSVKFEYGCEEPPKIPPIVVL
jgi:hypothetical protein